MNAKFGICDWSLPGNGLAAAKMAKELGLKGLQLGFMQYERGYLIAQKWFRDYYMEEADKYGIELLSIAMCVFDFCGLTNPRHSENGKKVYEMIDQSIEAADHMRLKMVMMPSFDDGFIETDEDLLITAEALKHACKLAAKYEIIITTENALTAEKNKQLFKSVDEPNLQGFYDSQNYKSYLGWDQAKILEEQYDLYYPEMHLKDGIGKACSSRLLGDGDADFYGTIKVLKNKNYSGWLLLENSYDLPPISLLSPHNYLDAVRMDLDILRKACQ